MNFTVYILFSIKLNRFYVGYTSLTIEERLNYHLSNHKGFTAKAKDWEVVWTKIINSKSEALTLEKKIKKRGAKRFIDDSYIA